MSNPPKTIEEALNLLDQKDALLKQMVRSRLEMGSAYDFKKERCENYDPKEVDEVLTGVICLRMIY